MLATWYLPFSLHSVFIFHIVLLEWLWPGNERRIFRYTLVASGYPEGPSHRLTFTPKCQRLCFTFQSCARINQFVVTRQRDDCCKAVSDFSVFLLQSGDTIDTCMSLSAPGNSDSIKRHSRIKGVNDWSMSTDICSIKKDPILLNGRAGFQFPTISLILMINFYRNYFFIYLRQQEDLGADIFFGYLAVWVLFDIIKLGYRS